MPAEAEGTAAMAAVETATRTPGLAAASRRDAYARQVVALLRRALPDAAGLELELAGEPSTATGRGTWRIYMASARRGFEDGSLDVAQLLLARPASEGPADLPLRPWWHG